MSYIEHGLEMKIVMFLHCYRRKNVAVGMALSCVWEPFVVRGRVRLSAYIVMAVVHYYRTLARSSIVAH